MKKYLKFAIIMAIAALFAACGYESTYVDIPGTNLQKFDLKTKSGKIVYGAVDSLYQRVIPPAYDDIVPAHGILIAAYTTEKGDKLCNLFTLQGKKAMNQNLITCEWKGNHFRATNSQGEFLYYPNLAKTFGPYQSSIVWQDIIFYKALKNKVVQSGFTKADGSGIVTNDAPVFVIKDKKTDKLFFAVGDGKKAGTVYDDKIDMKTAKKLSPRNWSLLQKKLTDKQHLSDKVTLGSVANIKAF